MRPTQWPAFLADIQEHGILEPIEITKAGVVLDGRHRLRAAQTLNLPRIPVRVVAPTDEVGYILRKGLQRRQLSPSQVAAVVVSLDEYQRTLDASRTRQRANLCATQRLEAEPLPPPGETLAALAARYGVSQRLLRDAHTIRILAPDQLAAVAAGDIPAHRLANRLHQHHRNHALQTPPLPRGQFDVILADPPWQLGNPDSDFSAEQHYPTLPLKDITTIHVPAARVWSGFWEWRPDAILYLWAVSGLLPEALQVIRAWGFTYKTNGVWVKNAIGPGVWFRNRHELLLTAVRGNWSPPAPELSLRLGHHRPNTSKPCTPPRAGWNCGHVPKIGGDSGLVDW
jgi:hypothetical protein